LKFKINGTPKIKGSLMLNTAGAPPNFKISLVSAFLDKAKPTTTSANVAPVPPKKTKASFVPSANALIDPAVPPEDKYSWLFANATSATGEKIAVRTFVP
jgi:hypothetical protein